MNVIERQQSKPKSIPDFRRIKCFVPYWNRLGVWTPPLSNCWVSEQSTYVTRLSRLEWSHRLLQITVFLVEHKRRLWE
jgi:hypothetical protein